MFQFQYRNKNQNFRISNFVVQFIKKKKKIEVALRVHGLCWISWKS